ncbi:uncharacterized protein, partial [Prorops nasuta]|uniref:uncharacterized protein n=1 Tax=Prorops nasuta TaxID=863751 RepID=UPI0034CE9178
IQFYQEFCAKQQQVIAETKSAAQVVGGQSQIAAAGSGEASRVNTCQFSTFKSSTGRLLPDAVALELASLSLGHHELGHNRVELSSPEVTSSYFQSLPVERKAFDQRNASADSIAGARQLDKQSYFFCEHFTERKMMILERGRMFEELGASKYVQSRDVVDGNSQTASGGSINCFGGAQDKENPRSQRLACALQRGSRSIEFLEKEGEIFKKGSTELLQEAFANSKKKSFSFRTKGKIHRSLESLGQCTELPVTDAKSLELLPQERPKGFFHAKQRSLDSSQKSKKSTKSSTAKPRKRPGFFQRVGRSLHFLPRENEKWQDLSKREDHQTHDYPQTDQEKCEYFLQKQRNDIDFFEYTKDPPVQTDLAFLRKQQRTSEDCPVNERSKPKEDLSVFFNPSILFDTINVPPLTQEGNVEGFDTKSKSTSGEDKTENTELLLQGRAWKPHSTSTQETISGNKDSLEIGYSISQLGRLYLQNLQSAGHGEGLRGPEVVGTEKKECYKDWIARGDLDNHSLNSSDRLGRKPQGNLDILKGILLDIFVCICI